MKRHTFLLGISLVAVACGGGQSGDPKSAAMFVGTWTANSQSGQTVTCGTQSITIPLWGTINISLTGANSGQIITQADNGCVLTWSCEGNIATVLPNSSCQVQVPPNGNWEAMFVKGTLTLGSNEISLSDNGNAVYTVNSAAQNCTFEQSGSFTDSAK